jgi:hypothetical protein
MQLATMQRVTYNGNVQQLQIATQVAQRRAPFSPRESLSKKSHLHAQKEVRPHWHAAGTLHRPGHYRVTST